MLEPLQNTVNDMTGEDYLLRVPLSQHDLSPIKTPPRCDVCASRTWLTGESVSGEKMYVVNALVLGGKSIWGLMCEVCVSNHHETLPLKTVDQEPEATRALRNVLAQDPLIFGI